MPTDNVRVRYDSFRHHRRSLRLKGYDYSWEGAYFMTICTKDREPMFGKVVNGEMRLNDCGQLVQFTWKELPERFPSVGLDAWVVMPNHVHGMVWIVGAGFSRPESVVNVGSRFAGRGARTAPLRKVALGQIVAYFKYRSTKEINLLWGDPNPAIPVWQRNYHDRIIRNDGELNRIRQYIRDNPENWHQDPENIGAFA